MSHAPEPTLIEFFLYNHWANQALMALCMGLSEELVDASQPGAYGSIRDTFAHLLKAEVSFLKRINGDYPQPGFRWEDNPGLPLLAEYEGVLNQALVDSLQRVPATQNVHEAGGGWTFDYQARLIFMSVVYHGIAHRTDITTALNSQGIQLPELDIWGYRSAFPERFQSSLVESGS